MFARGALATKEGICGWHEILAIPAPPYMGEGWQSRTLFSEVLWLSESSCSLSRSDR